MQTARQPSPGTTTDSQNQSRKRRYSPSEPPNSLHNAGSTRPAKVHVKDTKVPDTDATASMYWDLYHEHGKYEHLDIAIRLDHQSLKDQIADGKFSPHTATNLGVSYVDLYLRNKRQETLQAAISLLEQAAEIMIPTNDSGLPRTLFNLGNAYRARAERFKSESDLDKAIRLYENVLQRTPDNHPAWDLEVRRNGLARCLMARGTLKDIDRAMELMSSRREHVNVNTNPSTSTDGRVSTPTWSQDDHDTQTFDVEVGIPGKQVSLLSSEYYTELRLFVTVPDLTGKVMKLVDFPSGCGGYADILMGKQGEAKVAIKVLRQLGRDLSDTKLNDRMNKVRQLERTTLDFPSLRNRNLKKNAHYILTDAEIRDPYLAHGKTPEYSESPRNSQGIRSIHGHDLSLVLKW